MQSVKCLFNVYRLDRTGHYVKVAAVWAMDESHAMQAARAKKPSLRGKMLVARHVATA